MKIFPIRSRSIKEARTFMPEIIAPGTGLTPPTKKSVVPFNNVTTIQDILDGRQYKLPGGGGEWSSQWGEDVSKSYKDEGPDFRRQERDLDIFRRMTNLPQQNQETWEVKVPGGSKSFSSFELANNYKRKLTEKGIPVSWVTRTRKVAQTNKGNRVDIVSDSMKKTFMVETINVKEGFKLNGAAFCVAHNHFVTCAHVLKKYDKTIQKISLGEITDGIKVSLVQDGKTFPAEVVAVNGTWDIAILRCDIASDIFLLDNNPTIGEEIMAIGSPHGYENNVSFGNIGGLDRKIYTYSGAPDYMFVDLAAFTGNSGGPIVKEKDGSVTAMLTAIVTSSGEFGLNAGLPSRYIREFCIMNKIKVE